MAIYVPASKRRRTTILVAVAALVTGLVVGFASGRATAPSLDDQVAKVQDRARTATSQLRVVALHEDANTGTEGTAFALRRARDELADALDDAPWIPDSARDRLLDDVDALVKEPDRASASDIERVAKEIETAFGLT